MSHLSVGANRFAALSALFALAAGLSACSGGGSSGATLGTDPSNALPPIKVDLPPAPPFTPPDVPIKGADGVYSIYGLRKEKTKTLGQEVKVKGFLLEVYQCPVCPKRQVCKLCDQPHFFLGDKPDTKKEKALMVVDYLGAKQKPPALTVGKQYEVGGHLRDQLADRIRHLRRPAGVRQDDRRQGRRAHSPSAKLEQKALAGEAIEAALQKKREAAMKKK